jgi:hypothetical protein
MTRRSLSNAIIATGEVSTIVRSSLAGGIRAVFGGGYAGPSWPARRGAADMEAATSGCMENMVSLRVLNRFRREWHVTIQSV